MFGDLHVSDFTLWIAQQISECVNQAYTAVLIDAVCYDGELYANACMHPLFALQ